MDWRMASDILCYAWNDNKAVYVMSTIHMPNDDDNPPDEVRRRKKKGATNDSGEVPCPSVVVAYNRYIKGSTVTTNFGNIITSPENLKFGTRRYTDIFLK